MISFAAALFADPDCQEVGTSPTEKCHEIREISDKLLDVHYNV
jgi:hypothetical protein